MERHKTGEPVIVSPAVFEGLDLIRRDGACNMFDLECVLVLAKELGQETTAVWIRARKDEYARGLLAGFRIADPFWTAQVMEFDEGDTDEQ